MIAVRAGGWKLGAASGAFSTLKSNEAVDILDRKFASYFHLLPRAAAPSRRARSR